MYIYIYIDIYIYMHIYIKGTQGLNSLTNCI